MTRDWVHGVGHSPVCQILLQIVVRTVITSSSSTLIGSAEMLSTPADFQQHLYHVFIDLKKAFDSVWHAALRATMKYNISKNLIQVIKNLYNKATSAVLFNSSIGDWFRTTVGVRQGFLVSPTLFNIFLERSMTDL